MMWARLAGTHGRCRSQPASPADGLHRLYQIHGNDSITPVEETLRALDTTRPARQSPLHRLLQLASLEDCEVTRHLAVQELARFDTLQAYYSIAGRELEREIVPLLEAEKVGLLVWSPLAGGLLSGKFTRENQKPEGTGAPNSIPDRGQRTRLEDHGRHRSHRKGPRCSAARLPWRGSSRSL